MNEYFMWFYFSQVHFFFFFFFFIQKLLVDGFLFLVCQVTFIYIALLTIQIVTKQLHNIKIGKLCQKCKITRFNTQFIAEGISLLNLVMASSSSV